MVDGGEVVMFESLRKRHRQRFQPLTRQAHAASEVSSICQQGTCEAAHLELRLNSLLAAEPVAGLQLAGLAGLGQLELAASVAAAAACCRPDLCWPPLLPSSQAWPCYQGAAAGAALLPAAPGAPARRRAGCRDCHAGRVAVAVWQTRCK